MKNVILMTMIVGLSLAACQGSGIVDGTIREPNTFVKGEKGDKDKKPTLIVDKDGKVKEVDPQIEEKLSTQCTDRPDILGGVPLRILTTTELNLALEKLFPNLELEHFDMSARDTQTGVFVRNSTENITSAHVLEFRKMAEAVAAQVHDEVEKVADCTSMGSEDLEVKCIRDSIEKLTTTAFRRPLEPGELDKYFAFYRIGDEIDHREGMRYIVEMILQSPSFMYIFEDANDAKHQLSGREIAQHMSTMFTQSLPDEALIRAGEDGTLFTTMGRIEQARRLIESDLGQRTMKTIVSQWFGINKIQTTPLIDLEDSAIISDAEIESERFITEIINEGADWTKLLTSDFTIVNEKMATHYNIDLSNAKDLGDGWFKVKTDYSAGLLTQSSFLSVGGTRSVFRGHRIWTDFLCGTIPGAPVVEFPATFEGESARSKADKRMAKSDCASCHAKMDPQGLAFDRFDKVGRRLSEDEYANPLTSNGQLLDPDGSLITIMGPRELAVELSERKEARGCVANHMFTWAFARHKTSADNCSIFDIEYALLANGDNLKEALIQVVASDAFIQR